MTWATAFALSLADGAVTGATAMELIEHLPVDKVDSFVKRSAPCGRRPAAASSAPRPRTAMAIFPSCPGTSRNIPWRSCAPSWSAISLPSKSCPPNPAAASAKPARPARKWLPYVASRIRSSVRRAARAKAPIWCWTPSCAIGSAMCSFFPAAPSRRSWTASRSARRSRSSVRAPSRAPAMPRWVMRA